MYTIEFSARLNEEDNGLDDEDFPDNNVHMRLTWDDQPSWDKLTEAFLSFLKSQGYVFDIGDRLGMVERREDPEFGEYPFPEPADDELHEAKATEAVIKAKKKAKGGKKKK